MKLSALIVRYLLIAILGTVIAVTAVPLMRVGFTSLALWRSDTLISSDLPGPALALLLRVHPWQTWHPRLQPLVSARIAICFEDLNEAGRAADFSIAELPGLGDEPQPERLADYILLHPNRLANLVVERWQARWPPLSGEAVPEGVEPDATGDQDDRSLPALAESGAAGTHRPRQPPPQPTPMPPPPVLPDLTEAPAVREQPGADAGTQALPVRSGRNDSQWGLTSVPEARTYATDGRFLGRLPAGTLLSIEQVRRADIGDIAVATIRTPNGDLRDVVVRTEDLAIRPGSITRTSERERELCIQLARSDAALVARQRELEAALEARNPHARDYQAIRQRYSELWKGIEERQKAHEKATGGERMRLANELRQLKIEDVRFRREFETARARYQEWKQAHQHEADTGRDPAAQRLTQQRSEIQRSLDQLR